MYTHRYIAGTCLGDLRKSVITAHIQEKDLFLLNILLLFPFLSVHFFFFFLSIWNEQGLVSFRRRNLEGEVVGSRSQITQAPSSLKQLPLTQLLTLAAGSTTVLRSQEGWETEKELDSGYFWASMWQGDQKNKNPHLNLRLALPVWSWISCLTSLGLLSSSAIWRMYMTYRVAESIK